MSEFTRVSKKNPCLVCGKEDHCTRGDAGSICMRIASDRPCKKGNGFFHFFDGNHPKNQTANRPRKEVPHLTVSAIASMLAKWAKETTPDGLQALATSLGVSTRSLESLGVCWSSSERAWAFPMSDGTGQLCGIRLRSTAGGKRCVTGSRNGLFWPVQKWINPKLPLFLPEGGTSCSAGLSIGLQCIGRPNNQLGANLVREACARLGVKQIVVIADNDERKCKCDGAGCVICKNTGSLRPGIDGAIKFCREVGLEYKILTLSKKDLRDYVIAGGTKQVVESQLKDLRWNR